VLRYAITDGTVGDEDAENLSSALAARCAGLARSGVDFVLVREKQLGAGELAALSRKVIAAVREADDATRVLIAQRLDVAMATTADGVHLSGRAGELTVGKVRRLMPKAFVSVSCHTIADVERARHAGASAVLFAPVFAKIVDDVEVVSGVGLERLREACVAAGAMPVFALGGISEANTAQCVAAGAAGIAGIRLFFGGRQMN
jgi:thiamine-phosphate pyrophosphorylase